MAACAPSMAINSKSPSTRPAPKKSSTALSPPPDPPSVDRAQYQVTIALCYGVLPALEVALEPLADALLSEAIAEGHPLESRPGDQWRLRALTADQSSAIHLATEARRVLADAGQPNDDVVVEPVPVRDWVAHVERDAPPIKLGRFLIHATHHAVDPRGRIALCIEAGLAFGSGRHATTRSCLSLIERAARRGLAV
ncbi:MAG: hypothetical protein EXQ99_07750, partial [Alphaproteobacteria bacterium]|nr:hypothetical protein [Alphaproteobacteria bacterium]